MRVAVCVPLHGDPKGLFCASLANLMHAIGRTEKLEARLMIEGHSLVPQVRNSLFAAALDWGADWLLWLDADQAFPPDTLTRLLARNLPFVAANIVRKAPPFLPVAVGFKGEVVFTTEDKARRGDVEEVQRIGFGCCLVSADVFRAIERKRGRKTWPLFSIKPSAGGKEFESEDHHFCDLARSAGIKIHVDHSLSWQVSHVGDRPYTHQDAAEALQGIMRDRQGAAFPASQVGSLRIKS